MMPPKKDVKGCIELRCSGLSSTVKTERHSCTRIRVLLTMQGWREPDRSCIGKSCLCPVFSSMEEPFPGGLCLGFPALKDGQDRCNLKCMPWRGVIREEMRALLSWQSADFVCMESCVRVTVPQNPEHGCMSVIIWGQVEIGSCSLLGTYRI